MHLKIISDGSPIFRDDNLVRYEIEMRGRLSAARVGRAADSDAIDAPNPTNTPRPQHAYQTLSINGFTFAY
jgi:hypothetical protein